MKKIIDILFTDTRFTQLEAKEEGFEQNGLIYTVRCTDNTKVYYPTSVIKSISVTKTKS